MNFSLITTVSNLYKRFRPRSSGQARPVWTETTPLPCGETDASVTDFFIEPATNAFLVSGETLSFIAFQVLSNGIKEVVTSQATWTVDDLDAASVVSAGVIEGILATPATGFTQATVIVTATYNGRQASGTLTVTSKCNDCLVNMALVLDRSKSMLAPTGRSGKSTIDIVKEVAERVFNGLVEERDKMALISFGGITVYRGAEKLYAIDEATVDCPLTATISELIDGIGRYFVRTPTEEEKGGLTYSNACSGIAGGLRLARAELNGPRATIAPAGQQVYKVIVLITDGWENITPDTEPEAICTQIKNVDQALIYIVGINVPTAFQARLANSASPGCSWMVSSAEDAVGLIEKIPSDVCQDNTTRYNPSKISGYLSEDDESIPYGYLY